MRHVPLRVEIRKHVLRMKLDCENRVLLGLDCAHSLLPVLIESDRQDLKKLRQLREFAEEPTRDPEIVPVERERLRRSLLQKLAVEASE